MESCAGMPEGPSVRKFHHLVSTFVGQQVVKTGGSSKKLSPAGFQSLWLQDTQVHGKKLFLRFDPDEEIGSSGNNPLPESLQKGERKEEARAQQQALGPSSQISDQPSLSLELVDSSGEDGLECLGGDTPAGGAERWLQVHFGLFGSVWVNEFSRAKKANKRGDWKDPVPRLVLHFGGGGFLAFYNCQMSWSSSPVVKPTSDILSEKFHRGQALEALGQERPVCYTLLDQRYFSGLGNIIKNEALYRAGIHPLSLGSLLSPLRLGVLLDHVVEFSADWLQGKFQGKQQHTQIYQKEQCPAGHQVMKEAFGPPGGFQRLTWWCPQCQPRLPPDEPEQV
ncbi:endonuclease 8-like 2 isoform X1 [Diceros bicornis minor]|nr:endonuclease 8-like 2 isoform X1 [Diceros bicornis minor]XP_058406368.1 endonuclease 8-like 2 isoform X1 [Diceros bicornis minor]XP_058406369.1 endonuclease 8-like 2 isoform X1 [Diceros bicornis minor]XP_058406370.1 endonuclease 8-like 2 isoform X1 [Diceros bicornis minor]